MFIGISSSTRMHTVEVVFGLSHVKLCYSFYMDFWNFLDPILNPAHLSCLPGLGQHSSIVSSHVERLNMIKVTINMIIKH